MPPDTDEGAPADSSGGDPNQTDQGGSSGDGAPGEQPLKDAPQTLEQRARQNLQGLMDQNQEFLRQGRYQDMDPKVVQLLTEYDNLTRSPGTNPVEPKKADNYGPGFDEQRSGQANPQMTELAKEGLKSRQRELVGQIKGQVEQDILRDNWAEDIKALFAEHGKTGISEEDYVLIDPLNRQTFPFTRAGYRAWLTAARDFQTRQIVSQAAATAEGDGEGGSASRRTPVDRDRANAGQAKRKPQVKSAGQGAQDLQTAAKRRREGRGPSDAEFREQIKQTIKQSGMGGSTSSRP